MEINFGREKIMPEQKANVNSTGKSGFVERLKEKAAGAVGFKGYVFYFFSSAQYRRIENGKEKIKDSGDVAESAKGNVTEGQYIDEKTGEFISKPTSCKMIPLPSLNPILRVRQTGESFTLNQPVFFIEGKPVWFVMRGYPHSLQMDFENNHFVEKGYSSEEIDAKNYSIYVNRVFRQSGISVNYLFITVVLVIIGILIAVMITTNIYQTKIDNLTNSTGGILALCRFFSQLTLVR